MQRASEERARHGPAHAAEFGDRRAGLVADADVVNASALDPAHFARLRDEPRSRLGGLEVRDRTMLGDAALVVAVAGIGESRVGQEEDKAAVGYSMSVGHRRGHRHRERRFAGTDAVDADPVRLRRPVLRPQAIGGAPRDLLRRHAPPFRSLKFGARFSRNALTPSRKSSPLPASRWRSRSRSSWASRPLTGEARKARFIRP